MFNQSQENSHYTTESEATNEDEMVLEQTDLYCILNVSHDATQVEIQNAFKKLSRIYHPDKHSQNTENHKYAQVHFTKIREAYDILSDETNRKVYDMYGLEGVKAENWKVVARTRDPNELKMIYETRQRLAEEDLQNRLTRPETVATVGLDLTDIFDRYLKEDAAEHYLDPRASINKAELRHSVCLGTTTTDTVNLTAGCSARNGLGTGELTASWRRFLYPRFQDTWLDTQASVTTDSLVSAGISASRKVWDRLTLTTGGSLFMPRFGMLVPGLIASAKCQISERVMGEVEYKWNLDGQMRSSVDWHSLNQNHSLRVSISVGVDNWYLSSYYNFIYEPKPHQSRHQQQQKERFDPDEWAIDEEKDPIRFKVGGRYGKKSMYAEVGVTRRMTKFSTFGFSLSLGVPLGVMAKLKVVRGSQTYVLPLLMSEELDPAASLYGSLAPLAVFCALKALLYDPWRRRERALESAKRRQLYRGELTRRQQEAASARQLMRETARRCYQREKEAGGLIIECAVYGRLSRLKPSGEDAWNLDENHNDQQHQDGEGVLSQETVEVTLPLQLMVETSQLLLPPCLPGHTRGQLQGFYDPCLGLFSTVPRTDSDGPCTGGDAAPTSSDLTGVTRQLYVRYRFQGRLHEIAVTDSEKLKLPLERHAVHSRR